MLKYIFVIFKLIIIIYSISTEEIIKKIVQNIINGKIHFLGKKIQLKNNNITYLWESGGINSTHYFITARAIFILKKDKGLNIIKHLYQNNGIKIILEYSNMPDIDEQDKILFIPTFKGHFYDPYTEKNYFGEYYPTAYTRFIEHYKNAIIFFHKNKILSWEELGRAIHYIEDINVPHHAANEIATFSNHAEYELWCDHYKFNYIINTTNKYDLVLNISIENLFKKNAIHSKKYISFAKSSNSIDNDISACATFNYAQEIVACIFYKFLKDVNIIS